MRLRIEALLAISLIAAGSAAADQPLRPAPAEPAKHPSAAVPNQDTAGGKLARRSAAAPVNLTWRKNGTVASGTGFSTRSYAGSKEQAASAFLNEHRDLFGPLADRDLVPLRARQLGVRTYVRMQQQLEGVPVRGAQAVVQVSAGNTVNGFSSTLQPNLKKEGEWRWTEEAAIEKALSAHGSRPSDKPSATKMYVVRKEIAIPAWQVLFRSANPAGDWEYIVSADNGQILEKQDRRTGMDALGFAYPYNPVKGGRERVRLQNFASDQYLVSDQSVVFTYIPALKGKVEPGTVVFGANRQDGNFLFDADDARASEVQLYYGMENANAYFRGLGFPGFAEPIRGVVFFQDWDPDTQRFVGANNAFFLPNAFGEGKGGMFFYLTNNQGDTSLDTDVIYHEYTHAIVNELVGPYQGAGFKALNEGTADYFSNSLLNDPVMAEYAAGLFRLRTPYLRRSDNYNSWPYNKVGESHADGNIWSGALWQVRDKLGARITDEIALNAVAMLSPNAEFFDAAAAAVTAADELYGGRAAQIVAGIMEERGIFTRSARTASEAWWLESGDSAEGSMDAADPGYLLLGAQQYRIEVPNRATKLKIRIRSNTDVRFYLRYRVPVTIEGGYLRAEQVSSTGADVDGYVSLENTPELQAGEYFIAVVNTSTTPANYVVHAEVEGGDAAAMPAITGLENGRSANGSVPAGPFLASRQFAIEVPEGASAVSVWLDGDEDVDLYVRLNAPVVINGTGYPQADLVSDSSSSREYLRIVGADGGRPPAGIYVIGVYNYSSSTTTFQVRAQIEP